MSDKKVSSDLNPNQKSGDPQLDSIRGIIKLPEDFDLKKDARDIRMKKQL